jgi:hypothetical protein
MAKVMASLTTLLPTSPPNKSLSKSFTTKQNKTKQEKKANDSRSTKVRSKTHMMIQRRPPSKVQNERTKPKPNMIQQAPKGKKEKKYQTKTT